MCVYGITYMTMMHGIDERDKASQTAHRSHGTWPTPPRSAFVWFRRTCPPVIYNLGMHRKPIRSVSYSIDAEVHSLVERGKPVIILRP